MEWAVNSRVPEKAARYRGGCGSRISRFIARIEGAMPGTVVVMFFKVPLRCQFKVPGPAILTIFESGEPDADLEPRKGAGKGAGHAIPPQKPIFIQTRAVWRVWHLYFLKEHGTLT